jgi:hypothetical protein
MKVVFNYLKSDIVKRQRSFKIGLITLFLVILFTALLINITGLTPLIFLRLAENSAGETDIIMIPFLNQIDVKYKTSLLDSIFQSNNTNSLSASQNNLPNQLINNISLPNSTAQLNNLNFQLLDFPSIHKTLINEDFIQGLAPRWIFSVNTTYKSKTIPAALIVLNSELENKYGFGRNIDTKTLGLFV